MGSVAAVLFDCRGSGDYGLYVFTYLSALPTVSDGHIFLCLKKDMEERQTKGLQSRPLESCFYTGVRRGDVRASYEFAVMQFTRFRPRRRKLHITCGGSSPPARSFRCSSSPQQDRSAGSCRGPLWGRASHCFHGLMLTARSAAKTLALKE